MEPNMAFESRNSEKPIAKHLKVGVNEETMAKAEDQLGLQNEITNLQNQILDLNIDDVQTDQSDHEISQKKSTESKFNKKKMNARKETN